MLILQQDQDQVKLVAGHGVYICDECIELCNEIIEGTQLMIWFEMGDIPKPSESERYWMIM